MITTIPKTQYLIRLFGFDLDTPIKYRVLEIPAEKVQCPGRNIMSNVKA